MQLSKIWVWFVFGLAAIGLVAFSIRNWFYMLIPVGLGLVVLLLYKYPPKRFMRERGRPGSANYYKSKSIPVIKKSVPQGPFRKGKSRRKDHPFRVIEGSKSASSKLPKDKDDEHKLLH